MRLLHWLRTQKGVEFGLEGQGQVIDRMAEEIADAQEEVREGFMKKPRGREAKIHD